MEISFTDNLATRLVDVLKPSFSQARSIKLAVAFAKYSGYSLIERGINECLDKGGAVEFLVGLDFRITEPQVLRILLQLSGRGLPLGCFCFSDTSAKDTPVYHPKLYLLDDGEKVVFSIGSSNLTRGGLKDNVEVNAVFTASRHEEVVSDIYGLYTRLKFGQERFVPNLEYIEDYEVAYRNVQKKGIAALREKPTREIVQRLKEKEKTLVRPKPSGQELFGWQKLVYEALPLGRFRTSAIYAYEEEFRTHYPENSNIRPKIRQILQQLRDVGLVNNPSRDSWEGV